MFHKNFPRTIVAGAVLSAISSIAAAQTAAAPVTGKITTVIVTATPFGNAEGDQILTPAKVLSGDDLHNKVGGSLGETLSHELGVSASAFGAGASRPIIRGLEGSRVKVLENGMAVSDISGLSNDHAVATDGPTARQIEILRGPAALLYGSGAIGGLVNVVNDRIPTTLQTVPTGELEGRYGSADRSGTGSLSVDAGQGPFAVHLDASARDAGDYRIPGSRFADGSPDPQNGKLANSFNRQHSVGLGGSYIGDWGFVGASAGFIGNDYGIPTLEASQITMHQRRYDIDSLVKEPFAGFENFKFKSGYTNYRHSELDLEGVPQTNFTNRSLETRWEISHKPVAGWHGTFGMQTENTNFAALNASDGSPNTVPATRSTARSFFLVEEHKLGPLDMNAGARYEKVERNAARQYRPQFQSEFLFGRRPVAVHGRLFDRPDRLGGAARTDRRRAVLGRPARFDQHLRHRQRQFREGDLAQPRAVPAKNQRPVALEGQPVPEQGEKFRLRRDRRHPARRRRQSRRRIAPPPVPPGQRHHPRRRGRTQL